MERLIKASHIEFFKEVLDVDVTNVEIIDTNIDEVGTVGLYSKKNKRIRIDTNKIRGMYGSSKAAHLFISTTIVHELTHYCQRELNKSTMLPINGLFTGDKYSVAYYDSAYYEQPLEIDAHIMEVYYLYYLNGDSPAIGEYAKSKLNRINLENIINYVKRLNDKSFIQFINKSLNIKEEM